MPVKDLLHYENSVLTLKLGEQELSPKDFQELIVLLKTIDRCRVVKLNSCLKKFDSDRVKLLLNALPETHFIELGGYQTKDFNMICKVLEQKPSLHNVSIIDFNDISLPLQRHALEYHMPKLPSLYSIEVPKAMPSFVISSLSDDLKTRLAKPTQEKSLLIHKEEQNPVYPQIKLLHQCFISKDEKFLHLVRSNNKVADELGLFKNILSGKDSEAKRLVYEFMVVHGLCRWVNAQDKELDYNSFMKTLSNNAALSSDEHSWCQEIALLVSGNSAAIARQLNFERVEKHPKLKEQLKMQALQAKAWWGMVSFHLNDASTMGDGLLAFRSFLQEVRIESQLKTPKHETPVMKAEDTAMYWLRLAATEGRSDKAANQLVQHLGMEKQLNWQERYQLRLACEERGLGLPLQLVKPYANLLALFPHEGFFKTMGHLYRETVANPMMGHILFHQMTARYYSIPQHRVQKQPMQTGLVDKNILREQEFYLYCLLNDGLLADKTKAELVQHVVEHRRTQIISLELTSVYNFPGYRADLKHYAKIPLSRSIKELLIPLVEYHQKEMALVHSFPKMLLDTLKTYLKTGTLFGKKISPEEHPSHIALLLHVFIDGGLIKSGLGKTQFAVEIQATILIIKAEQQELYLRELNHKKDCDGFQPLVLQHLMSYYQTSNVAQLVQVKFSSSFGQQQNSEKVKKDPMWKRALNTGALGVEVSHVALPIILTISSLGGTLFSAFSGLRVVLEGINSGVETVQSFMHHHEDAFHFAPRLLHTMHFLHDVHPHHHAEPYVDFNTIVGFNKLIHRAAPNDSDRMELLAQHWAAIYQPVTAQLASSSNSLLATLLMELLLRAIKYRLTIKKDYTSPKTMAELMNYVDETLWFYAAPQQSDDILLVTKSLQKVSALSLIFPTHLVARLKNGPETQVQIMPKNRVEASGEPLLLRRNASSYEVELIDKLKTNSKILSPFTARKVNYEILPAYKEPTSVNEGIKVLGDALHQSNTEVQRLSSLLGIDPLDSSPLKLGFFAPQVKDKHADASAPVTGLGNG